MSNKIICGNFAFLDDQIVDGNCFIGESITGDELAIDTFEATVCSKSMLGDVLAPNDYDGFLLSDGRTLYAKSSDANLSSLPYGTAVSFYHDDSLVGKFYLKFVKRISSTNFRLSCVSAIGLLDKLPHYGGIYNGVTAGAVAADIIGDVVEYSIDVEVSGVLVYGWLPISTKRGNLHQLLFAIGASLKKTTAGALNITFLETETYLEISNDRLYLDGSVDYPTPATKAQVTEHAFISLATDNLATLFDNSNDAAAVKSKLVTFSKPCHDLTATGLTIEKSGVNYAVVSGIGTLTGKEYMHTTQIITSMAPGTTVETNTVSAEDATLVSLANSQNVADRLLAYHRTARESSMPIVVGPERPGDAVSFLNPFEEAEIGFVKQMDITLSSILKASAVIVTGYKPVAFGNHYNTSKIIAQNGVYSLSDLGIPSTQKQIRIVLIGGGSGGTPGADGTDGVKNETKRELQTLYAEGGAGGAGGTGGSGGTGGFVYVETLTITAASTFTISTGAGGAIESTGGETTCVIDGNPRASSSGVSSSLGYTNPLTGVTYARAGENGLAGGKGGDGGGSYSEKDLVQDGDPGVSVGTATGGTGGIGYGAGDGRGWAGYDGASGGGGGGAAYITSGSSGTDAVVVWDDYGTYYPVNVTNGSGGNGATPPNGANGSTYGCGGGGGHGGGGGGGAGGFLSKHATLTNYNDAGFGGKGSKGGAGAAGCVIIYY